MSHIITLETKLKDPDALKRACDALGVTIEENTTIRLFQASRSGSAISLPGWRYPIVVDSEGTVHYDNYGGRWGDIKHLGELVQEYTAQVVEAQAFNDGLYSWRESREDGTLVITVGSWQ